MANRNNLDIEDHYGAYLRKDTLRSLSHPFSLTSRCMVVSRKRRDPGVRRICRDNVRYRDFVEINRMFVEYLDRLKGAMDPSSFLHKMYSAELTGASVRICRGGSGIVVEERANSIIVVLEDDTVKTYIKRVNDFIIEHDGIEYIFVGAMMKTNRFTKK